MKIIYAAYVRFPSEKAHVIHIAKTCEAFVRHGAEVKLVVPSARFSKDIDPTVLYGLREKFTIHTLWSPSLFLSTLIGYSISSFFFGVALFIYLLQQKYDVLYSMELEPFGFWAMPFLRRPYFFEIHAPRKKLPHIWLLFSFINGIVVLNDAIKKDLSETFPSIEDKILVCPSALDLSNADISKEEARERLAIPKENNVAVYTGSLDFKKGVDTILDTAKLLPSTLFYLVGGTRSDNIPSNVITVYRRPYSEMKYWRAATDVLLATGTKKDEYSYKYTSPMKLLEYMSAKRPIVVARVPANEFVIREDEAFFYEPDNPESLKSAIQRALYQNTDEYVKRTYAHAKEYSWDARTNKIFTFFEMNI